MGNRLSVLLVNTNRSDVDELKQGLPRFGVDVEAATSCDAALGLARAQSFDMLMVFHVFHDEQKESSQQRPHNAGGIECLRRLRAAGVETASLVYENPKWRTELLHEDDSRFREIASMLQRAYLRNERNSGRLKSSTRCLGLMRPRADAAASK